MARTPVYMPKFGMTMTEALIVEWFRQEGDPVEQGDILLSIETEKANTDIEAPEKGILVDIRYSAGVEAPVGEILAYIADSEEESGGEKEQSPPAVEAARPAAAEQAADATAPPTQAAPEGQPLSGIRKGIAENMLHSLASTAQLTLMRDLVVDRLAEFKAGHTEISYNDLLVKAAALALRRHPNIQQQLVDGRLFQPQGIHIGLAVALEDGLVVPVIRNADGMALDEIARERKRLVSKAREGSLDLKEISEQSCTISNLGTYGIDTFTPILNPPETVLLGIGRILPRPWVEEDRLVIRKILHLSLTFDHQVIDGATAAVFLETFCSILDEPSLLEEG